MMFGFGILTGLLVVPLAGALLILVLRGDQKAVDSNARWIALFTTIATFALACVAWSRFDTANPGFQLVETHGWVSDAIKFKLGVDGFSFPFIVLTAFLMPFCIGASWTSVEKRVRERRLVMRVPYRSRRSTAMDESTRTHSRAR